MCMAHLNFSLLFRGVCEDYGCSILPVDSSKKHRRNLRLKEVYPCPWAAALCDICLYVVSVYRGKPSRAWMVRGRFCTRRKFSPQHRLKPQINCGADVSSFCQINSAVFWAKLKNIELIWQKGESLHQPILAKAFNSVKFRGASNSCETAKKLFLQKSANLDFCINLNLQKVVQFLQKGHNFLQKYIDLDFFKNLQKGHNFLQKCADFCRNLNLQKVVQFTLTLCYLPLPCAVMYHSTR